MSTLLKTDISHRLLPSWVLRIVGFSSFAVALINFLFLLCRRTTRRYIKKPPAYQPTSLKRTSSSLANIQQECMSRSSPYARTPSPQSNNRWRSRLVDNVIAATSVLKKKKKLTISLKNTILWNPSQDVDVSNHAFHENAVLLLSRLCQQYEVHLLIHINNPDEHEQIKRLLTPIISGHSSNILLDLTRIHYCHDEKTKLHLVQHVLCPAIHVEGGWELDDGEDMVRELRSSVTKLIWVITRRRRASFNKEDMKLSDQDILADNVELTDSLLDTSLARDLGFVV
ncbi:uncharacterized protein BX664DRAFT_337197 [Halteromyces radiatus]|uniref:uncharacterized protein n=1 Tax=Halteromyces radiatus TaxID=101107 RepID=UPI0022201B51|nr:uncharacterized protein BX664DRAFT_337197 [Halteromyces radiatus]KAI8084531.1 hypothetical protein BX664DRAFT_337197 [Halteromyces radiatus]